MDPSPLQGFKEGLELSHVVQGEDFSPIWGLDLTYGNPAAERAFREKQKRATARMVFQMHGMGLLIGGIVFMLLAHKLPLKEKLGGAIPSVLIPIVPVYLSYYHNGFLTKWYDEIVFCIEASCSFTTAYFTTYTEPNSDRPLFVLLGWSPVVILFIMAVVFPTSFNAQLPGQFLCMLLSHFWIYSFCEREELSEKMVAGMDTGAMHLKSGMSGIFGVGLKTHDDGVQCTSSLGFLHFALGFVVPCTMKYCMESHMRVKDLVSKFEDDAHPFVWSHFWHGVRFSFWLAAFSLICFGMVVISFA